MTESKRRPPPPKPYDFTSLSENKFRAGTLNHQALLYLYLWKTCYFPLTCENPPITFAQPPHRIFESTSWWDRSTSRSTGKNAKESIHLCRKCLQERHLMVDLLILLSLWMKSIWWLRKDLAGLPMQEWNFGHGDSLQTWHHGSEQQIAQGNRTHRKLNLLARCVARETGQCRHPVWKDSNHSRFSQCSQVATKLAAVWLQFPQGK